jgi:glycosyltransferase involved in cell wall biosynthesis
MACGTPVISSTGGSLPEVLGDAAVLVDGFDPDTWCQEVTRTRHDAERRHELIARGLDRAAGYTWTRTAEATWSIYRSVAETGGAA